MNLSFSVLKMNYYRHGRSDLNVLKLGRRFLFQFHNLNQQVRLRERYKRKKEYDRDDDTLKVDEDKSPSLVVTEENQYEILNDIVTPLWKVPYEDQLKMKWRWSKYVLNQFCSSKRRSKCLIESTIASPITEEYRNKSEMSIRKGVDGNMKTVGCFIGATGLDFKNVVCVSPKYLKNTPERHKQITQMYQDFIRSSPLPAMHNLFDDGFWKGLVIRTNNTTSDTMVLSIVHPQNFTEEDINENAMQLKQYFENNNANITSLYHQSCRHTRCSNETAPYKLLSGEQYLMETLLGYQFRISPDSFFQINKAAAELLYERVIEIAQLKPNTVLLDLCCGTGTISILCSSLVRCCIGIDIMPQAIADAKANATLNNITNCQFIEGRIEKTLQKVLSLLDYSSDIVAVVNPTRNGVEPHIIKAIRNCKQISKLVYISCKADAPSSIKNFHDLCKSTLCKAEKFDVTSITPVDLFPHTHYCELILVFER